MQQTLGGKMQKSDLITSLSHYNTFHFIHWIVCIQDGTVGYVLDTDPAYDRIVQSWDDIYKSDDHVNFIMEVGASHFSMDDIQSFKHDYADLRKDNGNKDFDGFIMWDAEYEGYYLQDMIDQMEQIRMISQWAKDPMFRQVVSMLDEDEFAKIFDGFHRHLIMRNGERETHTIKLGSHHNFLGYNIDQLNAVVDDYVSSQKLDGIAIDIEYETNDDGILKATFELAN